VGAGWLGAPTPDPKATALSTDELRALIDRLLDLGAMLLEGGADSALTERTLRHVARTMGCDELEVLITASGLVVTTQEADEFRTKARRVGAFGVHMGKVAAITELAERITTAPPTLEALEAEVDRIAQIAPYPRALVVPAVAVAAGAFSQLFGGGARELAVVTGVVLVVETLRRELHHRHFDAMPATVVCSALATALALPVSGVAHATSAAVVSAVCVPMIPGALFVNGARDILKGHLVIGAARGLRALLLVLAIALGISVAVAIVGRPA
jgi:uncharacterized membrane protein YjjP (DUF1212 family)